MPSDVEKTAFEAVIGFAQNAIKGLFLANGVAAITSLTTIGTMLGKPGVQGYIEPLALAATRFGWGVAAALACAALSYMSQVLFTEYWAERYWPGATARLFALAFAIAAIVLFVWGVETAASGFLGSPTP